MAMSLNWVRLISSALLICASLNSHEAKAFTVSADSNYFVTSSDNYDFIYSAAFRPYVKALQDQNRELKTVYQKEFLWQLDEKASLILASPRNQIANGFATLFPNLHTVFYGGGAELIDDFSAQRLSQESQWISLSQTMEPKQREAVRRHVHRITLSP